MNFPTLYRLGGWMHLVIFDSHGLISSAFVLTGSYNNAASLSRWPLRQRNTVSGLPVRHLCPTVCVVRHPGLFAQ